MSSITQYSANISCGNSGGVLNFSSQDGFDDSFALALTAALDGLPWAAGADYQVTTFKSIQEVTSYTADVTADPPVFV